MAATNGDNTDLLKRFEALQDRVDKLEAESEIRKLHHKYGYYIDKCLYKETVELFANDPDTYVQFLNGKFKGKAGAKRLYIDRFAKTFVGGRNGPVHGWLLDHLQAQDIVDFIPGTNKGQARFRTLMSAGSHESMEDSFLPRGKRQWWEGGVYENDYIKEDGVWKIFRLRYYPFWHGVFDKGWQYTPPDYVPPFAKTVGEGDALGPDELLQNDERLWPDTRVVPFHYPHPVTGKQVEEIDLRAPPYGKSHEEAKPARVISDAVKASA